MNGPATLEQTDVEIIEELDFEIPCDGWDRFFTRCEEPAKWIAICKNCGASAYLCDRHRQLQLLSERLVVMLCNPSGPALLMRDAYRYVPIVGA